MSEALYKKLLSIAQSKDSDNEFVEFLEKVDKAKIIELIVDRLITPDVTKVLRLVMLGLTQKNASQKKRLQLTEEVLKEVHKRPDLPNHVVFGLAFEIAVELDKFSTPHLVKLSQLCVDLIRSSTSSAQSCWKELLPKLLSVIDTRKDIDLDGSEISGAEFKKRIVQSICLFKWNSSVITALTAMFNDFLLSNEQLAEVVNKLCISLEELTLDEIPPFVHQLLVLCRENYAGCLFFALRNYFNKSIYSLNKSDKNTEDIIFDDDIDMNSDNIDKIKDCESTVLYHIYEAAKIGHGSIDQLLKFAKVTSNSPEFVLDPFILCVLLMISSINTYEDKVIGLLKNVFIRNVLEEEKKCESAWLRSMIPTHCDARGIVVKLIDSRACQNDKVLTGFINVSISLLSTKRSTALNPEKLYKLGQDILLKLVQKHKQVTRTVLKKLVECILGGQNVSQLTDCLRGLCDIATFSVTEQLMHVIRVVELLIQIPPQDAEQIIMAIIPVIRISSRLRDSLIAVLRKALFSKSLETRKMAVNGFLKLLKFLRVKNLINLSQSYNFSEYSAPSVFSQISADVHSSQLAQPTVNSNSNEAICLEVIGILKRCFVQTADVRKSLYEGLFVVIEHNSELNSNVLELLLDHFSAFYNPDTTALPPVDFSKVVSIQEKDAVLQEPLGTFLLLVQNLVIKLKNDPENLSDETLKTVEKFHNILESVTKRFIICDLNHFELDEETNILDILPECLQRQMIVYQAIAVYEALMAYVAFSWTAESTAQQGQSLESLFKGYNLLYDYVKNCKPSKKKGAQKKDKVDGKKGPVATFKPPLTILNLPAVIRLLQLVLCEDLEWATSESTASLRTKRHILRYILQAATEAIQQISKNQYNPTSVLNDMYILGRILYTRCFANYERFKDFDSIAATYCMECFNEIKMFIVAHNKTKLPHYLKEIDNIKIESGLADQLKPVITRLQCLLDDISGDNDDFAEIYMKREATALVNCLALLNLQLPVEHGYTLAVTDHLVEFGQKRKLQFAPVAKVYTAHMLAMLMRTKTEEACIENLAAQICELMGTHDDGDAEDCKLNFSILNETTASNVLPMLCTTLINSVESIRWLLARMTSEYNALKLPASEEDNQTRIGRQARREREMVRYVGRCINVAQTITATKVPPGVCSEVACNMLTRIYTTLVAIAKYFMMVSSPQNLAYQKASFPRIVKLTSFHLSTNVANFLVHVEVSMMTDEKEKQENKIRQSKKQAQYIPKLTCEMDNFVKCINMLASKAKDPKLSANMKLSCARDFRVNLKKVEEIMSRQNNSLLEDADTTVETQQTAQPSQSGQPRKKQRTI